MAADPELYERLLELTNARTPFALATIVRAKGSIPNELGAKMLVGPGGELLAGTIGGGTIEHQALAEASEAIAAGRSRTIAAKLTQKEAGGIGMMCGGSVEVFVDVHTPAPKLILCGAGHISLALARMTDGLGFETTVIDDRADWANEANYPNAEVLVEAPEAAVARLPLDEHTFLLIATRSGDLEVLVAAAATPVRYIGVVASKRKAVTLVKEAAPRVDMEALLPRLRAPVGLDLGGRSPEAVALSILAEIQRERYSKSGAPMAVEAERLRQLSEAG